MTNKNTTVKEVIEAPEFKNFIELHVFGVKCTKKEMDYLMENIQADQDLHIQEGEIPEDYNHPNVSFSTNSRQSLQKKPYLQTGPACNSLENAIL